MCKALTIDGIHIKRCEQSTENEFCSDHDFKKFHEQECSICYEKIDYDVEVFLRCGHIFHRNCIYLSRNDRCPYCDYQLNDDEFKYFICLNGETLELLKTAYAYKKHYENLVMENTNKKKINDTMFKLQMASLVFNYAVFGFFIYKMIHKK